VLIGRGIGFKVRGVRALTIAMTVASALLIAAHFLRTGSYLLAAPSAVFPALLLLRTRLAVRIVQLLLILAAAEWLRTIALIAAERQAFAQPWMRMALILGAVAAVTFTSAVLLGRRFLRAEDRPARRDEGEAST
jgi:hypothetical protein